MSDKFMKAQAYQDDWYEYEINGETFITDDESVIPEDAERGEIYVNKWFSRLSAPGYLDCTEWQGPQNTEYGALWELYQTHGQDHETFFDFLDEGKLIIAGSLEIRGSRNELYGRAIGEDLVHLATLGDIDLQENEETGEVTQVEFNPNEDPDLAEAYDFELIDGEELTEKLQELLNAKRDSEYFVNVHVFWLWTDQTWAKDIAHMPMELSEEDRAKRAIGEIWHKNALESASEKVGQVRLSFNIPSMLHVGVLKETEPWQEYQDAKSD